MRKIKVVVLLVQQLQHGFTKNAWICYDDVGFRFIHKIMYNICRSALINTMCKVYANLANCDCFLLQHTSDPRNRYINQCNLHGSSLTNVTRHAK